MNNKKVVFILHGWPQFITSNSMYYKYFSRKNFDVIAPNLYLENFNLIDTKLTSSLINKLNGKVPDVILGISMGGLLAPYIAQNYPKCKLILIATGSVLKSNSHGFDILLWLIKLPIFKSILNLVRYSPKNIIYLLYKIINPIGNDNSEHDYETDMKTNIDIMLSIPVKKHIEIARYISRVNNTCLLKNLQNETLIFSGSKDAMMPDKLGISLSKLIPNNRIVITNGSHFNVFTSENFLDVNDFLNN